MRSSIYPEGARVVRDIDPHAGQGEVAEAYRVLREEAIGSRRRTRRMKWSSTNSEYSVLPTATQPMWDEVRIDWNGSFAIWRNVDARRS